MKWLLAFLFAATTAQGALTVTSRGTDNQNSAVSPWAIGPSTTIAAGSMGVLCLAFDNAGSAGSAKILSSATITDSAGNTWTRRLDFIYDAGAASAGVEIGVYTAPMTTQLTSAGTVSLVFSTAPAAKAATWYEVSSNVSGATIGYIAGAAKCDGCTTGQSSGTPQMTSASLTVGDAVIAFVGAESTAAVTGDSDTTNGTWAAQQTDSSAGTMRIASQAKVQTTTASTQSYDVTITSCDWQTAYVQIRETIPTPTIYYSPMTVDHTKVPSTQTDFPVLINVTDTRFETVANGGHVAITNGYDIRPYSDSGLTTALTYELERYDASTGEVIMWVKIASLSSSSDTVIYVKYGDSSLTTDGSSAATWSNGFVAVYHLGNGTTLSAADAKGTFNGTITGTVTAATGKIDGAASFNGNTANRIDIPSITPSLPLTLSVWFNVTNATTEQTLLGLDAGTTVDAGWWMEVYSGGILAMSADSGNYVFSSKSGVTANTWMLAHAVFTSTTSRIAYLNGVAATAETSSRNPASVNRGTIGVFQVHTGIGNPLNGLADHVCWSSVARSQDWITTEYNNQSAPTTFAPLGTEVVAGGPTPNTGAFFQFFP